MAQEVLEFVVGEAFARTLVELWDWVEIVVGDVESRAVGVCRRFRGIVVMLHQTSHIVECAEHGSDV